MRCPDGKSKELSSKKEDILRLRLELQIKV
jgi:hypothetical protein